MAARQEERKQPRRGSAALWKWGGAAAVGGTAAGILLYRRAGRRGARDGTDAGDTRRPSWAKLLAEAPAAMRLSAAQFLPAPVRDASLGRGRAVLVIPGRHAHHARSVRRRRCGCRPRNPCPRRCATRRSAAAERCW